MRESNDAGVGDDRATIKRGRLSVGHIDDRKVGPADTASSDTAPAAEVTEKEVRPPRSRAVRGFLPGVVLIAVGAVGLAVYAIRDANRHLPGRSIDGTTLATNLAIGAARTGVHVTLACPPRIPVHRGFTFTCTAKSGTTTRVVHFEEANANGALIYSGLFAPASAGSVPQTIHPTPSS